MRRSARLLLLGLFLVTGAVAGESVACPVQKGLYDDWLSVSKRTVTHRGLKDALLSGSSAPSPDAARQQSIEAQYRGYFQCLSDSAAKADEKSMLALCAEASADRVAALVCESVAYVKGGRTSTKDFIDSFPQGRRGAELIWDLETITASANGAPAYKLIDELFLLVLDDRENAAGRYLNIASMAVDEGGRHVDDQIRILMQEAPAVVVKNWPVLRQYQPKFKQVLSGMPPAELLKLRKGIAAFCPKDNLDCPEIQKVFGRP